MYTSDNRPDPTGRRPASKGTLRQVNDTIRKLAGQSLSEESWQFLCECDDLACLELVELTLDEFDAHRGGDTPQPILAGHHRGG